MAGSDAEAGVMAGGGRYAESSTTQHGAAGLGLSLIEPAAARAELEADGPLLIADFGAAEGTNSLLPIGAALDTFARRAPGRPVFVVHTDIPGNDFSGLCETLERSPQRYTARHPEALPLMAGRSLYDRIFPAGRLRFGWTASTLHWLSEAPGTVRGHFFVQLSDDAEAKARFAARSAADWRRFLDARAAELAPGAGVVIVDVAMDEEGTMGSEALFECLNRALASCHERGTLDAGELERIAYPTWFRSAAEMRAPFAPTYEAAGGERLELVELQPTILPDPFDPHGDPGSYARSQVAFLSGFLAPSFAAALREDRTPDERSAALDAVWSLTRDYIAADPVAVSPRYRLVAALIARVSRA